ncbi:segregation and condensation protein A [Acidithiobacillus ferrivorans]|nr:ScpA family protein [Acidithiobacillus ferrivorans]
MRPWVWRMGSTASELSLSAAPMQVHGRPLETLPDGLFIPPDALELLLESFAGPLELLLWLIRRNRMDIRDIPVAEVTRQYLLYLHEARRRNLELAAEYLLMAAWLAEIKARMLLPVPPAADDEDCDPRLELARRLEALATVQGQAAALDALPQDGRDFWSVYPATHPDLPVTPPLVTLADLVTAWQALLLRPARKPPPAHALTNPHMGLRQRMMELLLHCRRESRPWSFIEILPPAADRLTLAVSLLALLELLRQQALILIDDEEGEWRVAAVATAEERRIIFDA